MLAVKSSFNIKRYNASFDGLIYKNGSLSLIAAREQDINHDIILNPGDVSHLPFIKTEKRKKEYVAVRMLAKSFISELIGDEENEIKIMGGYKQMPYVFCSKGLIPVSFSHRSGVYAVLLSPDGSMMSGVDVEKFENIELSAMADFFNDSELDNERDLIIRWSVKESILKMISRGLKLPASDICVGLDEIKVKGCVEKSMIENGLSHFSVDSYVWNDFVISLAYAPKIV